MGPMLQSKILRGLQDREIRPVGGNKLISGDVRIIAATNRDLAEEIEAGLFREDLFHRLNVIRIHIPPLRERKEDIPALLKLFLKQAAKEIQVEPKILLPEVEAYLSSLDWPGNVRQLENSCRWITVMASSREIHMSDLPPELLPESSNPQELPARNWEDGLQSWAETQLLMGKDHLLDEAQPRFERIMITAALGKTHGRRQEAAKLLGWGRNTLTRKIKELGMETGNSTQ